MSESPVAMPPLILQELLHPTRWGPRTSRVRDHVHLLIRLIDAHQAASWSDHAKPAFSVHLEHYQ